jgi:hypothetical protein
MGVHVLRHSPAALPPERDPVPSAREAGWPQGRTKQARNISPSPEFDPCTVQSVVSPDTDCSVPTRIKILVLMVNVCLFVCLFVERQLAETGILWNRTVCSVLEWHQLFERTVCLHLHGRAENVHSCVVMLWALCCKVPEVRHAAFGDVVIPLTLVAASFSL